MRAKTLIVDDEPLARMRMRTLLEKYPDRQVLVIPADLSKREECMRNRLFDIPSCVLVLE